MDPVLVNLQSQVASAAARLAELDAVPIDQRVKMTYSDGEQMYDWNAYRAALEQKIAGFAAQVEGYLKAAQMISGPFTVLGRAG